MKRAQSGFAAVTFSNPAQTLFHVYVIGGNDGTVQSKVEFLDLSDLKWKRAPEMNQRRDELAAVIGPDNKIYAIGGYGGTQAASCLSSVERYDPTTQKWEAVANMNQKRRALAAVAMPDGVYAIGGFDGEKYVD
jgi:N-acetylneuraminic acid mutarotase